MRGLALGRYDHGAAADRVQPRFKLFQPATMVIANELVRVHLLDLSTSGALIHAPVPPAMAAIVRLECAGRMRMARVVWVAGNRFGIAFALPLQEDQVAGALVQRPAIAAPAARSGAAA